MVPRAFLRFVRPELDGGNLIVRATADEVRRARQTDDAVPLGYLYEITTADDPHEDLVMSAGHYDPAGGAG